jgi:flagellar biosynthesis/type III secretory pathway protein FliH
MQRLRIVIIALFVTAISASASLAQRVIAVQPGRYEIEIPLTGKLLDLRQEDLRSVQQYYRGNVKNQLWDIENAGGNYYYIRSAQNGAYLGIEGTSRDGAQVVTTPSRQDSWRFMELNNGTVMIMHRSGRVLDLTAGATHDGALLQVWSQAANTHQQFKLVPANLAVASNNSRDTSRTVYDYDPRNTSRIENNEAYQAGINDRVANLSQNYRRHRSLYDRASEQEFQQAYNRGYSEGYRNQRADGNDSWRSDPNDNLSGMSQNERNSYQEGYRLGQQDARAGYSASYRRYSNRYNRWHETVFQRGYEAGYSNPNNSAYNNDQFDLNRLGTNERRAYDEGYRLGQQDARNGFSLNYRRYINRINDTRLERFLQRGYEVGYNSTRR